MAETYEEEEDESQPVDIFDLGHLDSITDGEIEEALDSIVEEDSLFLELEAVVEIRRHNLGSPDLAVRYFGVATDASRLTQHNGLAELSISHLQLVEFDYAPWILSLLRRIGQPPSLRHLSLYTRGVGASNPVANLDDTLAHFVNLTHLSVGGDVFRYFSRFYESLKLFPLEYLCFGPHVQLRLDSLMDTVPNLNNLKTLVLDNIRTAEEGEDGIVKDNVLPVFPAECSYEEMRKLVELGKRFGITITGSTIRAVAQKEAHSEHIKRLLSHLRRSYKAANLIAE